MRKLPRQKISYSLNEPLNVEQFGGNLPELVSITTGIVEVDFQQHTVILPEGKFDLDSFLRIAKDIRLRLP